MWGSSCDTGFPSCGRLLQGLRVKPTNVSVVNNRTGSLECSLLYVFLIFGSWHISWWLQPQAFPDLRSNRGGLGTGPKLELFSGWLIRCCISPLKTHIHTHMHAHLYTYSYWHIYTVMPRHTTHTYIVTLICTNMHLSSQKLINSHTWMHINTHTHIHSDTYKQSHMHLYTQAHTYIHIYTLTCTNMYSCIHMSTYTARASELKVSEWRKDTIFMSFFPSVLLFRIQLSCGRGVWPLSGKGHCGVLNFSAAQGGRIFFLVV